MTLEELLHLLVIADDVEIEQPLEVLENEPLLQTFAAFVEPVSKVADAQTSMLVNVSERLADGADQFANLAPLRLRERTHAVEKIGVELRL